MGSLGYIRANGKPWMCLTTCRMASIAWRRLERKAVPYDRVLKLVFFFHIISLIFLSFAVAHGLEGQGSCVEAGVDLWLLLPVPAAE